MECGASALLVTEGTWMICPKCGFEQPESAECMRCGIVISRYKGPVLGQAGPPPVPPAFLPPPKAVMPPPPPLAEGGPVFGGPRPPATGGGSVYGGQSMSPAVAGGGTLYDGPMPPPPPAGGTVYGTGTLAPATPGFVARGTFEAGKILGESFSIYFSNFLPFSLLTALALAPMFLTLGMFIEATKSQDPQALLTSLLLLLLTAVLCPQLATASITFGVFQQMRGRDASIGDCLGKGLSALLPVLGLVIVQAFYIFLGLLALRHPRHYSWSLRYAVSVPVAVEERPGLSEAMRRSTYLTEGYRGAIFGVLFILNFMSQAIDRALNLGLSDNLSTYFMASGAVSVLTVGLSATATAVMYYRLRSIKESIDVDQISSVFD